MIANLVIFIVFKIPKLNKIIFCVYCIQLQGYVIHHNKFFIEQSGPKILLNTKSWFSSINCKVNNLVHNVHWYFNVWNVFVYFLLGGTFLSVTFSLSRNTVTTENLKFKVTLSHIVSCSRDWDVSIKKFKGRTK